MVELIDIFSNIIPESQKETIRQFCKVRDSRKLQLYELLESRGCLPPQLKEKLNTLRTNQ